MRTCTKASARVAAKISYLHNALGQSYLYDDGQLGNTPMLLGEYGNGISQPIGRTPTTACTPSMPIT